VTPAVLDASAILAFLRSEPGSERVSAVLPNSLSTTVNLAEIVGVFTRHGVAADTIRDIVAELSVSWVPIDEDLAYRTGILVTATRAAGLSLGDRACLALAQRLGVPTLTADRAWAAVADAAKVTVEIIR
jgi:ribonuclease VapC